MAGERRSADALMEVVENVIERGCMTADLGGGARTEGITSEMCGEVERGLD